MDYGLVLIILVFVEGIVILRGLMELSRSIEDGLDELDQNMAQAITTVVENLSSSIGFAEPMNPIQQVLAQFLQNAVENQSGAKEPGIIEINRDGKGQFQKKE
tara:strand:+ start:3445 stop:3753 length:309 start_codon:yes stop_codon:yes gene_type:complete